MRNVAGPIALTALVVLSCWGCGTGSGAPAGTTVPVKGKVTYKGQPLTQGSVVFEPDGGREANGEIKLDGTFELTTFKIGDGAVPGVHRVGVTGSLKGGKSPVPVKYRSPSSSKLEVEVSADKTDYSLNIK
jgi:hypothetical protein